MKNIWINKSDSFKKAAEFDKDYYLNMGPTESLPKICCDYDTLIHLLTYGFYYDYRLITIDGDELIRRVGRDTTSSIAFMHGFFWGTIWNHDNNEELRNNRDNPNALYPGDVIFIPDRQEREESGDTGQRHRFRRRGVPERLRLRLLDEDDEPRANVAYTLEIDGNLFTGTTDSEGMIEHPIPPNARRGRLLIGESQEEEHELSLGHLDPIHETSGVQARLTNLNLYAGEISGEMNNETRLAIREFQRRHDLEETGEMNDETRSRLQEVHGS